MAGNSFGSLFKLTTFGESHGAAIGGIIDGCPPNVDLDIDKIQEELNRRRPGQSKISTPRDEKDQVQLLSGVLEGRTTGTPIGFVIQNEDHHSKDYDHLKEVYRPSHADNTYQEKYGIRDHRGGGRSSARETACRVVAGAIARQFLESKGISVIAYVSQVLDVAIAELDDIPTREQVESNLVRCPNTDSATSMLQVIESARSEGDTVGGIITCVGTGVPAGLGEPVFDKFHADLGKAMLSINAVKGFEIGSGFNAAKMKGSVHNDSYTKDGELTSNNAGGVQGGITNGHQIVSRIAFKPVATLMQPQMGLGKDGRGAELAGKGRHDPCVLPRATPIVEAMMLLTIMDHYLRQQAIKG